MIYRPNIKSLKALLTNKLGLEEGYSIWVLLIYYYVHLIGKVNGIINRLKR